MSTAPRMFEICVQAIRSGVLIQRQSAKDKEFHFQNWFKDRLSTFTTDFEEGGRNSYPDFRLVHTPVGSEPEGYELKGLAYPGREADYDCNSQVPCGKHVGRTVYYVFGRYPDKPQGNSYPVLDLVICHGSLLNADDTYVHKNKSFRGFGSYGDILVRDRKMYVAPTPFALAEGTAHRCTLIVPDGTEVDATKFVEVGTLVRKEVQQVVGKYAFDLQTNEMETVLIPNPNAGKEHVFKAYRLAGDPIEPVTLRSKSEVLAELALEAESDADD